MYKTYWIITIPDLTVDKISLQPGGLEESDRPVILVRAQYMLNPEDAEEALYAAICQLMPRGAIVARKGMPTPDKTTACAGMGECYWLKGTGWLDEPRPGAVYIDPFDMLKKTPFLYKV